MLVQASGMQVYGANANANVQATSQRGRPALQLRPPVSVDFPLCSKKNACYQRNQSRVPSRHQDTPDRMLFGVSQKIKWHDEAQDPADRISCKRIHPNNNLRQQNYRHATDNKNRSKLVHHLINRNSELPTDRPNRTRVELHAREEAFRARTCVKVRNQQIGRPAERRRTVVQRHHHARRDRLAIRAVFYRTHRFQQMSHR